MDWPFKKEIDWHHIGHNSGPNDFGGCYVKGTFQKPWTLALGLIVLL